MISEKSQWLMVFAAIFNDQIRRVGKEEGICLPSDGYSFDASISIVKYLYPELNSKLNSLQAYIYAGVYGKEENIILSDLKRSIENYFRIKNRKAKKCSDGKKQKKT